MTYRTIREYSKSIFLSILFFLLFVCFFGHICADSGAFKIEKNILKIEIDTNLHVDEGVGREA